MTRVFNQLGRNLTIPVLTGWLAAGAFSSAAWGEDLASFCDRLPRPAYAAFEKHPAGNDWFQVYELEKDIFAIYEPFQWQEVISYLVIGADKALLVDTGNGLGDIKAVVDQLTTLPVTVINTHTHFDHIGGNHQFNNILSVATEFSIGNSKGVNNEMVKLEASSEALCKGLPEGVTQASHAIKPFSITGQVGEGDVIDLGTRKLEVLQVPGHTDDAIALLDRQAGFLWTGDSFYEGPIWLFFPETDLAAYRASIARLAGLAPELKVLFPAHNTPRASPSLLLETQKAFESILKGQVDPVPYWEGVVSYEFAGFGFLLQQDHMRLLQ